MKKINVTGSYQLSNRLTDSRQVVIHAVTQRAYPCQRPTKLRILHSAKKINHGNSLQW